MDSKPLKLSYEVNLEPGETLVLPPSLANIGPGHWVVTVEPVDATNDLSLPRISSGALATSAPFAVVKNDGSQVPFDRNEVASEIVRACAGLDCKTDKLAALVDRIEEDLVRRNALHVKSDDIKDMIMDGLQELSDAAYIRYALGQREF
ncbi:MAG: ATP cone domain-containing protein [Cyanobacteria bacterium J06648_11]